MKKTYLFLLATVILITSCNTQKYYYQVYDIASPEVKQDNNVMVYENSDCRITYNLWSDGGNMNFLLLNKTDKNLYVVMPMSFFILNGIANDYYTSSSHSLAVTNSLAVAGASQVAVSGYITNGFSWYPTTISRQTGLGIGTSKTESVTYHEMPNICIPPKSSKFIRGFNISDYVYIDCDNKKANYPKYTSPKMDYDETNSPLVFKNRIAYTFDENSKDVKYIENNFRMVSFLNYSEKAAFDVKYEKPCDGKYEVTRKNFKISAPNKFYNRYQPSKNGRY